MSYCFNPQCSRPQNQDQDKFCTRCGSRLWLADQYQGMKFLGQGGFGRTFLARNRDQNYYVIKQLYLENLSPNIAKKAVELFQQEATYLQQLGSHPQIPKLFDHFEYNNHFYLIQEFIDGILLSHQQWKYEEMENHLWKLLQDILPILAFIHEQKVIHRDIKPENIIYRHQDQKYVLIDFGVSRFLTETALLGGATIVGTPEYMSPEQSRGKVIPASDLYSLGVTCLHMMTGSNTSDLYDVINENWRWKEAIKNKIKLSLKLTRLIDRLIDPSLKSRFISAQQVLKNIEGKVNIDFSNFQVENSPEHPIHSPSISSAQTDLMIPIDINYQPLATWLHFKQWEKADQETRSILCQLVGKYPQGCLTQSDINKLPCDHLVIVNQLWKEYSHGHFGFEIQMEIFEELEFDYPSFCQKVGWNMIRSNLESNDFTYSLKSPQGHLPSYCWMSGRLTWYKQLDTLYAKLKECAKSL